MKEKKCCKTCRFLDKERFNLHKYIMGCCQRFPKWEEVRVDEHHCGEHKETE